MYICLPICFMHMGEVFSIVLHTRMAGVCPSLAQLKLVTFTTYNTNLLFFPQTTTHPTPTTPTF